MKTERDPGPWEAACQCGSRTLAAIRPTKASALKRLRRLGSKVPREADVVVIGDSLAAAWPSEVLERAIPGKRIFNFGLPGDRIQNTLWRATTIEIAHLRPELALILVGTNNLADGDEPEAVASALMCLIRKLHSFWSDAEVIVVTVPKRGPHRVFRDNLRSRLNRLIVRSLNGEGRTSSIDADAALAISDSNWTALAPDRLHLSHEGYLRLTAAVSAHRARCSPESVRIEGRR